MTEEEIRQTVLRLLGDIAPEADLSRLKPDARIRSQLDIDSMDFLNFIIALNKELRYDVPERDYAKLATLQSCVAYLTAALADGKPDKDSPAS